MKSSPSSIVFQHKGSPTVSISSSALSEIAKLTLISAGVECGGILVGYNKGKDIDVVAASDPGPNARQTETHFLRDTPYCREFLARCHRESGADYVGEWHSHVVGPRHLSAGDINTLAGILVDSDYDFASFSVILVIVNDGQMELLVYLAEPASGGSRNRFRVTELFRGSFPEPGVGNLQ